MKSKIDPEWFHNRLSVKMSTDGALPLRFTDGQLQYYDNSMRSLFSAGICLDVVTDSELLVIDGFLLGNSRNYSYADLYVDNLFIQSVGKESIETGDIRFEFKLPGMGMRRVKVYLPHNVQLLIRDIVWLDGADIQIAEEAENVLLCYGDSITQGMDARYPSSTYPVILSRKLEMKLINQGVGGYYFDAGSLAPLPISTPKLIAVAYGANDWAKWSSMKELADRCNAYLDTLLTLYPTSRMIVITPLWRRASDIVRDTGTLEQVRETISQICAAKGIKIIDGSELIPHDERFFADGLHPTDEGFARMSASFSERL